MQMTTLNVVGSEDGQLILVSSDGERFTVPINEQLSQALRQEPRASSRVHRTSPKEIQAHIRRGLSAQQVADLTGEDVAYVTKFEGAVIAEREFIVSQAHEVAVQVAGGHESSFAQSVRDRLREIGAVEGSWSAWREESGWHVELRFTEGAIDHAARWEFDPRKHTLKPLNDDATVLSRHEPMPTTLIPKLQAVSSDDQPERFDSEIFESSDLGETGPMLEPVPYGRQGDESPVADTTDLLEALRKKRGERESAGDGEGPRSQHPATGGIYIVDEDHDAEVTPITGPIREDPDDSDPDDDPPPTGTIRKDRPAMPSWDDIVFGTRSDDDPA